LSLELARTFCQRAARLSDTRNPSLLTHTADDVRSTGRPSVNRWRIAVLGTLLQVSLGSVYAWSYFQKPLAAGYGWTNTQVAWTFSLAIGFLGLAAAAGGVALPRFGPRALAVAGSLLYGLGYLLAALALQWKMLGLLWLGFGVIGGIGLGLGYVTPVATAAKWFPDRKGLVTGMVVMGFGFGALLMSKGLAPGLNALFAGRLPWVFAGAGLAVGTAALAASLGLRNPPATAATPATAPAFPARDILCSRQFLLMWLLFFCNITAGIALIGFQSPLLQDLWRKLDPGLPASTLAAYGATLIAASSVFNGLGRLFWGGVSDRLGQLRTFRVILASQIAAFGALMIVRNPWLFGALICYVLLCYGGGFGVMPSFVLNTFGNRLMPVVYGCLLTAWSAAGVVGPQVVARLTDHCGDHASAYAFRLAAGLLALGFGLSWLLPKRQPMVPSAGSDRREHQILRKTRFRTLGCLALAWTVLAAGSAQAPGEEVFRLWPTHPLAKVLQDAGETAPAGTSLELEGARGETVSGQAVLTPGNTPERVSATITELRQDTASDITIPATCARLQWLRYVRVPTNTADIPLDELVARAPVSLPDPYWEGADCATEPKRLQPLGIELEVPPEAKPGRYLGRLTITGPTNRCALPISLRVRAFALPREPHQKVIQWWDFPGRTFENLSVGSPEYWQHLGRCCALVKRHRQTDIWVQWSLIQERSLTNGTAWDTSLFEKYVETAFAAGLRAVQFPSAGRHTRFQLDPESRTEAVEANLARLTAVEAVVRRRGWQGRVYTAIADEPFIYHEETYARLLERVRRAAPSVGTIEAVESDRIPGLDIYVPKLTHINLWWPQFEQLKRQGKEVWFYTCCFPRGRYPNRFLDQPLVKARALHWISYLYGLDGYLHWGFNWFTAGADPYTEAGRDPWSLPPGDSQVAYPGKAGFLGSLRLSAMRDGLQDYEYLWLLETRIREIRHQTGEEAAWLDPRQRPTELCRRVVQSFYDHTRDPQVLLATRHAVADEIESLDDQPLLLVQTSPPEGTLTPAGPITINIRGLATPGTKLTINGKTLLPQNFSPRGAFIDVRQITAADPQLTIAAELNGNTRIARRTFRVAE
jgi:MFS transporter, OFA family, oxalate/formate antiporter